MKSILSIITCILSAISINTFSQNKLVNQINLSNSIQYSDTSFTDLPGNGFLIDTGDEILAVTCKHALWVNRPKELRTINLNGKLKVWKMVVPNDPSQFIILGDLVNANSAEIIGERNTDKDYLVFRIKENHSKIKPLKISPTPVQAGDSIFQVGWSYKIKKSLPKSFVAIVKGYLGSSLLASYVIQDNYAGLSGSPVVNGKNELVGIVSSWKFDISSGNWYNAPCSTDYLWETLYSYWIVKNKKTKSINSFQEFIANYKTQNGVAPVVTPYLITQLFYTDWLKSKGFKYGSIESYAEWSNKVMKENGIKITADPYQKSLLVFDSWKEGYAKGKSEIIDLEAKLAEAKVSIPNFIDFCEYSQELSSMGKHEKSIALLIYADQKIQHMGQLYAYLGDAYLAKGDKALAKENYLKCLKTYPEYPKATDGLLMLK